VIPPAKLKATATDFLLQEALDAVAVEAEQTDGGCLRKGFGGMTWRALSLCAQIQRAQRPQHAEWENIEARTTPRSPLPKPKHKRKTILQE